MLQGKPIQEISASFQEQRYFPSSPVAWVSPERSPVRHYGRKCSASVIYNTLIQLSSMDALQRADAH